MPQIQTQQVPTNVNYYSEPSNDTLLASSLAAKLYAFNDFSDFSEDLTSGSYDCQNSSSSVSEQLTNSSTSTTITSLKSEIVPLNNATINQASIS
jgi:hypothetical protein